MPSLVHRLLNSRTWKGLGHIFRLKTIGDILGWWTTASWVKVVAFVIAFICTGASWVFNGPVWLLPFELPIVTALCLLIAEKITSMRGKRAPSPSGDRNKLGPAPDLVVEEGTHWYGPDHTHVYKKTYGALGDQRPVLALVFSEIPRKPMEFVDGAMVSYGPESDLVLKNCSDYDAFVPSFRMVIGQYTIFSTPHQAIPRRTEARMIYGVGNIEQRKSYSIQYFGQLRLLLDEMFSKSDDCQENDSYLTGEISVEYKDVMGNSFSSRMKLLHHPEMVGMPVIEPVASATPKPALALEKASEQQHEPKLVLDYEGPAQFGAFVLKNKANTDATYVLVSPARVGNRELRFLELSRIPAGGEPETIRIERWEYFAEIPEGRPLAPSSVPGSIAMHQLKWLLGMGWPLSPSNAPDVTAESVSVIVSCRREDGYTHCEEKGFELSIKTGRVWVAPIRVPAQSGVLTTF